MRFDALEIEKVTFAVRTTEPAGAGKGSVDGEPAALVVPLGVSVLVGSAAGVPAAETDFVDVCDADELPRGDAEPDGEPNTLALPVTLPPLLALADADAEVLVHPLPLALTDADADEAGDRRTSCSVDSFWIL